MTKQEMKSTLTAKQNETFEILIKLGDSIELAYQTVINKSKKEAANNDEMYYQAYCL